jgi:hypothetical protein
MYGKMLASFFTHPDRHKTKIKNEMRTPFDNLSVKPLSGWVYKRESMEDHELKTYETITIILMLIACLLVLAS